MVVLSEEPAYGEKIVFVRDDFLNAAECAELTQWTVNHLHMPFFVSVCGRVSTRSSKSAVPLPPIAYQIQRRVVELFGFEKAKKADFCDGIYSGYSRTAAEYDYESHRDPVYYDGTYTVHCNIVTTDSSGGAVRIENFGVVEMKKGRLVAYPVSELEHEVLQAKSSAPRNLWVFGFCIDKNEVSK